MVTREAQAVVEKPALLKLKQLETLRAMAADGGKFVIGLEAGGLADLADG